MLRILLIIGIISTSFLTISSLSAAEPIDETAVLSLNAVKVINSTTIRLSFSEGIDMTSIVLKIVKQSDNSAVSIKDMQGIPDQIDVIDILLSDELQEGSSYTITVQAAIGISGSTIIDGAGAQSEFVTPSPLSQAEPVLNAPKNPQAVIAEETDIPSVSNNKVPNENPSPMPASEELPLTGMNSIVLLLAALIISYFLLRRKHA